jgi:CO/xanthine dehydrogenase FAD-binding subunit
VPAPILDDSKGTAEYRKFVLKNTLLDVMTTLGGT